MQFSLSQENVIVQWLDQHERQEDTSIWVWHTMTRSQQSNSKWQVERGSPASRLLWPMLNLWNLWAACWEVEIPSNSASLYNLAKMTIQFPDWSSGHSPKDDEDSDRSAYDQSRWSQGRAQPSRWCPVISDRLHAPFTQHVTTYNI